jgi:hypothetical protein
VEIKNQKFKYVNLENMLHVFLMGCLHWHTWNIRGE